MAKEVEKNNNIIDPIEPEPIQVMANTSNINGLPNELPADTPLDALHYSPEIMPDEKHEDGVRDNET